METKRLNMNVAIIPLLASLLLGCGGGSDGDNARLVSGVWTGQLSESSNTCGGVRAATSGNFTYTVNQNEDAVTLQDDQGITFLGNTVGDNGFSVDSTFEETFSNGTACVGNQRIEFNGIEEDSDNTADVSLTTDYACGSGLECAIRSVGASSRGGGAAGPTPTTAPTRSGCADLRERSFSGDSGCGVVEADVSLTTEGSNTVVLITPLGANGTTSFIVASSDPSVAAANRTDLQFLGETGYSCSISCPSDITFTLNCFQEGGSICAERF